MEAPSVSLHRGKCVVLLVVGDVMLYHLLTRTHFYINAGQREGDDGTSK
jgi:hypothetical protein